MECSFTYEVPEVTCTGSPPHRPEDVLRAPDLHLVLEELLAAEEPPGPGRPHGAMAREPGAGWERATINDGVPRPRRSYQARAEMCASRDRPEDHLQALT
ncbi:hypothetical protein EYF80_057990 [Liparis tanakae]|uniref:Uncharacterized protein n=1 Tax=Liparis tanakae TaxID=230148 RepID=A0A4Z2ETF5_9TELE|nr:hypothetical protein EYF80_057990 [Liparis tanakae]